MSLLPFKVDLGDIADLCWRVCCDWKLVKRIWCFMACIIVFGAKRRILTDKLTSYQFDLKSCWRVDYCFFTGHCKHRQASNLIRSFWQEEDMFICLSTVGNCTAVDSYIRVNLWIWILRNNIRKSNICLRLKTCTRSCSLLVSQDCWGSSKGHLR